MSTSAAQWVDGPLPLPPLFGLLQAAAAPAAGVRFVVDAESGPTDLSDWPEGVEIPFAGRERWLNGITVYPYPPNTPINWDGCAIDPDPKPFGESTTPPAFAANTIVESITCTSQQVPDQAAFKARALRILEATEGFAVEREFLAGGTYGSQPFLADGNGVFPNDDTATRPNDALQLLEEQIALTGRLGLIHCSPMFATALLGNGMALSDKTGVIRTINGNVVIPGFGYAEGATPNGHASAVARQEWVFATGAIDVRRSQMFTTPDTLAEALDRSLGATNDRPNEITYYAERYVVVDWDTALQAAVLADRCMTTCGIPS